MEKSPKLITPDTALHVIPKTLRTPLFEEFNAIINNFMERRWMASELSGGRFCEIVYSILEGYAKGTYPPNPSKPANFVDACRKLESNNTSPRSFQILIPRLLPVLYEIRNNRNVGHVGGDVNPDLMDCSAVVSMSSWILAEMVRVFHNTSNEEAQQLVDNLVERRHPLVWKSGDIRRVLTSELPQKDQILLLLTSVAGKVPIEDLFTWTGQKNRAYFNKLIHNLHDQRFVEFYNSVGEIEILPPGSEYVSKLLENF